MPAPRTVAEAYLAARDRTAAGGMVHVDVGTANALVGVMNAARAQVPLLFTPGRAATGWRRAAP